VRQYFNPVSVGASPSKTRHPYHNYRRNNIIDNWLKYCIFVENDDLLTSGSTHQPDEPDLQCGQSVFGLGRDRNSDFQFDSRIPVSDLRPPMSGRGLTFLAKSGFKPV
jgi:hypothetical protein